MIWEESKHPRDDRGRFTDGKSLAKEVAPNENAERLKNESIESLEQKLKMEGASNNTVTQNFAQEKLPEHNPDYNYVHQPGKIAGAEKGNPMTFKQADSGNVNPYYNKGFIGYEWNCQTCVAVYFARRLGYDVRALPNFKNFQMKYMEYHPEIAYIDENGHYPVHNEPKQFEMPIDFLNRVVKNGEIHTLQFHYVGYNHGHIIIAEKNETGRLILYDPQIDKIYSDSDIVSYLNGKDMFETMDLSKCKINEKVADTIMKAT